MLRLLQAGAVAGLAIAVGAAPLAAQDAQETFKIGGLLALSGPLGVLGEDAQKGMDLAIEERGGMLLGVPVEITWEDTESKPQVAVQKATQVMSSGAQFLVGSVGSSETLAIMKVSGARKVPMLVPLSSDPSITGENGNDYTFRTASSGDTLALVAARYLEQLEPSKIYGVASDYAVARAGWEFAKGELADSAEAVGEDFPSYGETDFSVIVNKINGSGAEAAYIGTGGSDSIAFIKQAGEIGLLERVKLVGPNLVDTTVAAGAGDASIGVATALRYDPSIDTEANKAFVAAYKEKYGTLPSQLAGDAYDGLKWWMDVVDSTGSWNPEDWMAAFSGHTWDGSILGTRTMRDCDNQSQHPSFIAEAAAGSGDQPYEMKILQKFEAEDIATACPE